MFTYLLTYLQIEMGLWGALKSATFVQCLVVSTSTIRYRRLTCAEKLTRWPA